MVELISLHIPKTAGRSFLAILNSVYENGVAHFDRKNFPDKTFPAIEQFKSQISETTRIIHGHFKFSEIRDLQYIHSAKIITWIRNPVERVISNYSFFMKRATESTDDESLHRRRSETLIEYASLEESRNRMSKFINGLSITDFYFIGITEYFDEGVRQLARNLNWIPFSIPRINVNDVFKSGLPAVSKGERALIEELNEEDIKLYEKVLRLQNKKID